MSFIPHTDGYHGESTGFGATKATALELVRRTLEARDLGWITAVSECQMMCLSQRWTVALRFLTSCNMRFSASVTLGTPRDLGFPISGGVVTIHGAAEPYRWNISPQGVITRA